MNRNELISCFQDTLKRAHSDGLKDKTAESCRTNKIYKEGFVSNVPQRNEHSDIIVESGTTFAAARKYLHIGKTAVLNFANPENPGGGVQYGAMAQEECLCRSSNLYPCLCDANVFNDYYEYHRNLKNTFYSDRLIYTQDITVFKDDNDIPQILPKHMWFTVDVITCAAPYIAKRKYTNSSALLLLFKSRIKNIFEAARDNKADVIVLGAFGCGAFKNQPLIVAEAFRQVICEQDYFKCFRKIVFAIKPTGDHCPNLSVFSRQFDMYAPDAKERCSVLLTPPKYRFYRKPTLLNCADRAVEQKFHGWQAKNRYFGKQFSILGDSISTLDGYNPKGYNVFYSGDNCVKSGVREMADTWWDKVIGFFGGELLVNNSWSGSRVTKLPGRNSLFPSACSDERTSSLHINSVMPDVIIVYLGTNDWAFGANTGNDTRLLDEDDNELFDFAYNNMLKKLKTYYPHSEIWCCTLSETFMSKNPDFTFPHKYAGTHIEEYNEIIRNISFRNKCKIIDLYRCKMPYDSIDGTHPTSEGMSTIATAVIREMMGEDADCFLDCPNNQHNFIAAEEYTGGTDYVCTKCGKKKTVSTAFDIQSDNTNKKVDESDYVLLDSNITTILYSNTLRLTIESTGKTVQFRKDIVSVGRSLSCDLPLNSKKTIARQQATFFYEDEMWFLRDDFSTNGTWINGARMQPGKKYQLAANDEINFAMSEKVFFDKREHSEQPTENADAKALVFLEAGMATFAKSEQKDEVAFKLIVAALSNAPLYFPVEIDIEAMLGNVDVAKLKQGDTLQPQKDVKMRILTLALESGDEFVPMFTSIDEANKGPSASIIRYYPQDYLPMLVKMDKPVVINPFNEFRFLLSKQIITEVLMPAVRKKVKAETPVKTSENEEKVTNDNLIGKKVGDRYTVLKLLGQGGFFKTYLVIDEKANKQWAMKVCDKHHKSYSPALRDIILQEPHMMMELDHPAVPRVVDIIEGDESICIIREYIEGETLDDVLRNNGPVTQETAINWAQQLCDVLGYLHKQNPPYIYRDMKPANVILQPDGNVKLVDFGTVKVYDVLRERDDCVLVTRGYAAPEQYSGKSDMRSDIYSLGMTLHHLVTGVDPYMPPYETKPIRAINPQLSTTLEAIIIRCTQLNPEERFQNCDELMTALQGGPIYPPKKKGFFDKLFGGKSSKPKVNPRVQNIYNGMNKDYREKVFYGSLFSAESILTSLTRAIFGTMNDMNIDLCFQIYLQTWIQSRGGLNPTFSTPTYIKQALCEKFSTVNSNVVSKCVTHSLCEIYRHEPELKKRAAAIEAIQKSVCDNAQKNVVIENAYLDDPEYGLVPEKPVFVNGFGDDKAYLSHLHSEDGTKLSFVRVGSSEIKGISGPVDMYRLLLPDGTDYLRVFICNYGSSTKKAAPKGTKYLD